MVGFVFADEREAKTFWKKVTSKKDPKSCEFHNLAHRPVPSPQAPSETRVGEEEKGEQGRQDRQIHDFRARARLLRAPRAYGLQRTDGLRLPWSRPVVDRLPWPARKLRRRQTNNRQGNGLYQGLCPPAPPAGREGTQEAQAAATPVAPHTRDHRQHLVCLHCPAPAAPATRQSHFSGSHRTPAARASHARRHPRSPTSTGSSCREARERPAAPAAPNQRRTTGTAAAASPTWRQ